ncbi:MAG: acyl-CoA dehydrogenase family protein [Pseudomonadota bacterium]
MDFAFTQEQEMLRDSVARFLEKSYDFDARQALVRSDDPWSADVWGQFAELGLLALPFSEERGGLGGSIADCVAFAGSLGKHLVVEPYVHTILLAGAALDASDASVADEWIAKMAAGEALVAFAYEEGAGTSSPDMIKTTASASSGGFTISGEKRLVVAGAEADALVVAAKMGQEGPIGLFLIPKDAAGLTVSPYQTIDGRSAAKIRFDNVTVGQEAVLLEDATEPLTRILVNAIIAQSAEAVGAMGALLSLTSEYAMTRKQFGKPIMMFQAVAHRLSDMKMAYTKALSSLTYTTALANSGAATKRDIAILKGQVGSLGRSIGEAAIQTHGGVGMTDELSVSHYHKRLIAYDAQLGDHHYHFRTVGMG